MSGNPDETDDEPLRIPVVEEVAHVGVRRVETGRVRVRTVTQTEDASFERDLRRSDVTVERVPVDRWIEKGDAVPTVRTEGNVTVVPVIEEVLVVEKRLRVVEEIRITSDETTDTTHIPVRLRRQRAIIERAGPDGVFLPETPATSPDPKD